jgi:hypothetical protein
MSGSKRQSSFLFLFFVLPSFFFSFFKISRLYKLFVKHNNLKSRSVPTSKFPTFDQTVKEVCGAAKLALVDSCGSLFFCGKLETKETGREGEGKEKSKFDVKVSGSVRGKRPRWWVLERKDLEAKHCFCVRGKNSVGG